MPIGMRVVRIADGAAMLRSEDDFEARLILIPAPKDADLGFKIEGDTSKTDHSFIKRAAPLLDYWNYASLGFLEKHVDLKHSACIAEEAGSSGASAQAAPTEAVSSGTAWRWRIMSLDILPGNNQAYNQNL